MFETMGQAMLQSAEGQRQIAQAVRAALAKAMKRAAAILARQAQLGGFMP